MKRILGMGNALVDILVNIESDAFLQSVTLPKGGMTLVEDHQIKTILENRSHLDMTRSAGGSAANTLDALGRLGVPAGFIGKVGNDPSGDFFESSLRKHQVKTLVFRGNQPTGHSLVLISPDSERTMATHLGAAVELSAEEITEEHFRDADLLYLEGYLLLNPDLVEKAVTLAEAHSLAIAVDLASFTVVSSHREMIRGLLRNHVDMVFANEDEAARLVGFSTPRDNLAAMARMCPLAVVKVGPDGALVHQDGKMTVIDPLDARRVDTTGAGDLFAAGFLFGWARNYSVRQCGILGTILASQVIEVIGAKMSNESWHRIHQMIRDLV